MITFCCFHYGSKVPVVTITVFITILEQNRYNSCQSSTKFSEEGGISIVDNLHQQPRVTWSILTTKVNVKNTFTSHIDKKYFWHFCWLPYLYAFSLYENPSFIIVSACFCVPIFNLTFIISNISEAPVYGLYISKPMHYSRVWVQYCDFLD
jgi:hypothetical protein